MNFDLPVLYARRIISQHCQGCFGTPLFYTRCVSTVFGHVFTCGTWWFWSFSAFLELVPWLRLYSPSASITISQGTGSKKAEKDQNHHVHHGESNPGHLGGKQSCCHWAMLALLLCYLTYPNKIKLLVPVLFLVEAVLLKNQEAHGCLTALMGSLRPLNHSKNPPTSATTAATGCCHGRAHALRISCRNK